MCKCHPFFCTKVTGCDSLSAIIPCKPVFWIFILFTHNLLISSLIPIQHFTKKQIILKKIQINPFLCLAWAHVLPCSSSVHAVQACKQYVSQAALPPVTAAVSLWDKHIVLAQFYPSLDHLVAVKNNWIQQGKSSPRKISIWVSFVLRDSQTFPFWI